MVIETIVSILFVVTSPLIVLSNLLIVAAFLRCKRTRSPSNLLILSLSCADAGFGLCLPIAVIYYQTSAPSSPSSSTTFHPDYSLYPGPSSSSSSSWSSASSSSSASTYLEDYTRTITNRSIYTNTVGNTVVNATAADSQSDPIFLVSSSPSPLSPPSFESPHEKTGDPLSLSWSSSSSYDSSSTTSYMGSVLGPLLVIFLGVSVLTVAQISLDRFTSVAQPLRYNHFVTNTHVHRFLLVTWTVAILIGILIYSLGIQVEAGRGQIGGQGPGQVLIPQQQQQQQQQDSSSSGSFSPGQTGHGIVTQGHEGVELSVVVSWLALLLFLPSFAVALLCYGYIYIVARSHARAIYSVEVSLNAGGLCQNTLTDTSIHHHRYGLTLALILTLFFLSWAPMCGAALLDYFAGTAILRDGDWRAAVALPILIGTLLNPWLYGYRSAEIRMAVVRLVDSLLTRLTGRPGFSMTVLGVKAMGGAGELTSCASNVRLLAISPTQTQTTVQCCPDRNHLQILLCDQTSL